MKWILILFWTQSSMAMSCIQVLDPDDALDSAIAILKTQAASAEETLIELHVLEDYRNQLWENDPPHPAAQRRVNRIIGSTLARAEAAKPATVNDVPQAHQLPRGNREDFYDRRWDNSRN